MTKRKKTLGNTFEQELKKDLITKVVTWSLGIGAGYFLVLKPIMQKVGIVKTSEDKEREKIQETLGTSQTSPFNPNYYKTVKNAMLITRASAEAIAKRIYDAKSWYNDDEDAVFAALRVLKTKAALSFVAETFYRKYNADLYQFLVRNFESDIPTINSIASGLNGFNGLGCNCQQTWLNR